MLANGQRGSSERPARIERNASELSARVERKRQGEVSNSLPAGGRLAFLLALCSSFARLMLVFRSSHARLVLVFRSCPSFARIVILVTERCAVGRVASQESWVNAGEWINDGNC
jgi:hypothetical protein